jgi:hypothetical protein
MEDDKKVATDQAKIDKVIADRAKIEKLKASTEEVKAKANQELRRSLELSASFYEKLAALNAGSIAVAVSVGVALLGKAAPHSAFLHSNLNWLVAVAFFLWLSLICAIGHNALFIKVARLEAERAEEWSKWIGLINASTMQSITGPGDSEIAQTLVTHIGRHPPRQDTEGSDEPTSHGTNRPSCDGSWIRGSRHVPYGLYAGIRLHHPHLVDYSLVPESAAD